MSRPINHFQRFGFIPAVLVLSGCGGSDGGGTVTPEPDPPGTVQPATGGTVATQDGTASVAIPAGALTATTQITIAPATTPPADANLIGGTAYEFGPTGTQFQTPVQLRLKYDESRFPDEVNEDDLFIAKNVNGVWQRIPGAISGNSASNEVVGSITSFSAYAVMANPCTRLTLSIGTERTGRIRTGDCVFVDPAAGDVRQDLYRLTVGSPMALRVTMNTDGFRPIVGLKEAVEDVQAGAVYAFRLAAEGVATAPSMDMLLAPGTYDLFAGNRGGPQEGGYTLSVQTRSEVHDEACRAFFVRPPLNTQQTLGSNDCRVTITVSPFPDAIGREVWEEYFYVKLNPNERMTVTVQKTGGDADFQPFPTIFLPQGGAVQTSDLPQNAPRTISTTATASAWFLVGISAPYREDGGLTQGSYSLSITIN